MYIKGETILSKIMTVIKQSYIFGDTTNSEHLKKLCQLDIVTVACNCFKFVSYLYIYPWQVPNASILQTVFFLWNSPIPTYPTHHKKIKCKSKVGITQRIWQILDHLLVQWLKLACVYCLTCKYLMHYWLKGS